MKTIFCSTITIQNLIISVFEPEGSENEEEYKKIHDEYKNLVYKWKFFHKKSNANWYKFCAFQAYFPICDTT